MARDGTVVFPEDSSHGAAIITANGVEYRDRSYIPPRVVHRDAHDPWQAPLGFILPRSGRFTQTSRATVISTPGLAVVLRPSDTRVPSWGGEVLVRLEVFAPANEEEARAPERVALVVDTGTDPVALRALVEAALDGMGARDRVTVVDLDGTPLLPPVTGRYRTLAAAAIEKRSGERSETPNRAARPALPEGALRTAHKLLASSPGIERVVVLTDAVDDSWKSEKLKTLVGTLAGEGTRLSFVGVSDFGSPTEGEGADDGRAPAENPAAPTSEAPRNLALLRSQRSERLGELGMIGAGVAATSSSLDDRCHAMRLAVPPSGEVRFKDVVVSFSGAPAPSQVIESSSGEVRWRLDAGEVALGDVSAGEARAEVLRVSVPAWVPGEPFALHAEARFVDAATNQERKVGADLASIYDEDLQRIAESRNGDVIAFASALATLKRLDRAFVGEGVDRVGGLRALATLHAKSMALLARDTKDPAIREQAEVLSSLLRAP